MIITPPGVADASGHAAEMYAEDQAEDGFVHSYTKVMATNPEADEAFVALVRAIVPSIGPHVYEAATLGAARAIGSTHCLLAHGRRSLRTGILDQNGLLHFAQDDDSSFDQAEQAVIRYAAKLSSDPASMTDADSAELRRHGFDDRQIVDITLAAAARNYYSRALLALAVPSDELPGLDSGVDSALRERSRH